MFGFDLQIIHRADDFKRTQNPQHAVKFSTRWLRIQMTAHHHRRQRIIGPGTSRKHIAHTIDRDGASGRFAPFCEEFAALLVEIGQSEPLAAAFRRSADLGHFHQSVP